MEMPSGTRVFHCTEGTSNKFWKGGVERTILRVHYGRIGTAGSYQDKTFYSNGAALNELSKLIREKRKKGYWEVTPAVVPAVTAPRNVASVSVAPVAVVGAQTVLTVSDEAAPKQAAMVDNRFSFLTIGD